MLQYILSDVNVCRFGPVASVGCNPSKRGWVFSIVEVETVTFVRMSKSRRMGLAGHVAVSGGEKFIPKFGREIRRNSWKRMEG
jgi:hypothetical protein